MFLDIIFLIAGLVLILAGANYMTDGSVALAKRFGMSDFLIGLTIVAMMTSAPELVVSVTSALNASSEMAISAFEAYIVEVSWLQHIQHPRNHRHNSPDTPHSRNTRSAHQ